MHRTQQYGQRRAGDGSTVGGHADNAQRTEYSGRKYASRSEARFAERLDLEQRAGVVRTWSPQVRLALEIPQPNGTRTKVATYVADFQITYADGRQELVEVKGFWTREAKLKRRLLEATWLAQNPSVSFRVVTKVGRFGAATDEPDTKDAMIAGAFEVPLHLLRPQVRTRSIRREEFRRLAAAGRVR